MTRRLSLLPVLLTALSACSSFHLISGRSIVLSPSSAPSFRQLCSRPGLPNFEDTWSPSPADIDRMERDFARLRRLRSRGCCLTNWRIRDINSYYRQYVGVVVNGRLCIYINAFPVEPGNDLTSMPATHWCDGGDSYWGALYDVERRVFLELAFNGLA